MRAYKPKMDRCCPGHDEYSSDHYNNRRSVRAHAEMTKKAHRAVRHAAKASLASEIARGE